jgi:hypothetical protein
MIWTRSRTSQLFPNIFIVVIEFSTVTTFDFSDCVHLVALLVCSWNRFAFLLIVFVFLIE